jgi:hypothetical protein
MKTVTKKPVPFIAWCVLAAAALLVAGCAGQKGPATQAIASIETTLGSIRDDAAKYASTELQQAETALAGLKDSLARKDYKGVIAAAPGVTAQVAALQSAVTAKKAEVQAAMAAAGDQWRAMSADLPNMIAAIESRVDTLGQSKKLPKTLSADAFKAAKEGLDFMKSTWAEASKLFGSGNAVDAVAKANAVKEKGAEVLKLLGMGQ